MSKGGAKAKTANDDFGRNAINPPKFYGETSEDFEKWFKSFERSARSNGWSVKRQVDVLPAFLRDRAADYWEELPEETQNDMNLLKEAFLQQREEEPMALMCTLSVTDHHSASGEKRYMLGMEPILTTDGAPIADKHGRRSFVTSAGSAPSLGKHLLMAYLPPEHAVEGTELLVEYLGERYPVVVDRVGATPLFDSTNERILS